MFDQITNGGFYEFPSFEVALFSILLSFVLSSAISFCYHFTSQANTVSRYFIQAMVLSAIVTCMVIMAVGNNIAVGFGIMGAIAIVRFRMRIENPRNIIFIFATLSVGIASGVYGYSIAIAGTLVYCLVAILLFFSPYGTKKINQEFNISLTLISETDTNTMHAVLKTHCLQYRMLSISERTKGNRFDFFVLLKPGVNKEQFFDDLQNTPDITNVRLTRSDNLSQL